MPTSLHLPDHVARLARIPETHVFADRNVVIVETSLFHGFGSTDIAALNIEDVDLVKQRIRRRGSVHWLPLHSSHLASWSRLVDGVGATSPLCRSKSGRRMSRVDIWRVLRRVGIEGQLPQALHSRRARKWVGHAMARRACVDPQTLALAMGVSDLRAIAPYLPLGDVEHLPGATPLRSGRRTAS